MHYPVRLISSRSRVSLETQLGGAGVDSEGIRILTGKAENLVIRIDKMSAPAANIIKQQLLSLGGDAAVHRDVIAGGPKESTVYIIADRRRLAVLIEKLAGQPFKLGDLGKTIGTLLHRHEHPPALLPLREGTLDLSAGPLIMGVLNVTPDSFSDGGLHLDPAKACDRALEMVDEGAAVIDIGGESSRPGSRELTESEEIGRIAPVLEKLAGMLPVPFSIDTRKAAVARLACEAGAGIVNDISGLRHDPAMMETVAVSGAAAVVMHMQGTPETMQAEPHYHDPVSEIYEWLDARTETLIDGGVRLDKIIVDPGIGFGKRLRDNLDILHAIGDFHSLGFPVIVGYSRKSFIGELTKREPGERLWGGFAALAHCLDGGVQIVRVHDVKETADFIRVWKAVERRGETQ
ncbi:MAG: dihydropteroate synthase [bacterium]|nr:MAG: dihydropteroate synthase [bacterium]